MKTMFNLRRYWVFAVSAILFAAVYSCGNDDDNGGTSAVTAVSINGSGNLVDENGNALYHSSADYNLNSNCTGGCLSGFALVEFESGKITIPTSISGVVSFQPSNQTSGKYILTMNGRPVYRATSSPQFSVSKDWYIAKEYDVYISKKSIGGTTFYFLTDENGKTLYKDTNEKDNISSCTNCVGDLFYNGSLNTIPAYLSVSDFKDVQPRPDNIKQLAYKGNPLYLFAGDKDPGDTKAHGSGTISVAVVN